MSETKNSEIRPRPGRPRGKGQAEATKTLDRGLTLLEQLGTERLTLSQISRRTDLHPSTASRLIRTLCQRGFVVFDEADGSYRLSDRLVGLAEDPSS